MLGAPLGQSELGRAQRRKRVVAHLSRPHKVPQRLLQLHGLHRPPVHLAKVGDQVGPERGAALEARPDGVVQGLARRIRAVRRRAEPAGIVAEVERDLARMAAERPGPDPHQLAGGAESVHPGLRVRAHPAGKHVAFPDVGCEREPLEGHEHLAQPVDTGAARWRGVHALPGRQQPGERPLLRRLDLAPVRGQRGPPQPAQHLRIAPLALGPARAQLAPHQLAAALELAQHRRRVHPVASPELGGGERTVGARVAAHQPGERLLHRLEEGLGQPTGRHGTERVAVEAGVLGGDPPLLAADPHDRGPALGAELLQHAVGGDRLERAGLRLGRRDIAHRPQHVVERVRVRGPGAVAQVLQVGLDIAERVGVDQLAQLLLPEQLAQQVAVE